MKVFFAGLFVVACVFFNDGFSSAQPLEKKELEEKLLRKNKFIKNLNDVGRFQAFKFDSTSIVILDTREGHIWLWGVLKGKSLLVYFDRVYPGKSFGETMESWKREK